MALPAAAAEAVPLPKTPEAGKIPLKALKLAELNPLTETANWMLDKGMEEGGIRSVTSGEIKDKLTSVTNEEKKTELANLINRQDVEIDNVTEEIKIIFEQNRENGIPENAAREMQDTLYPEILDNLFRFEATDSQFQAEARETLQNLGETTQIYIPSQDEPITLTQWRKDLEMEATSIWKKELSPSATDEQFSELDPLSQYAFLIKAKQSILGTSGTTDRINKGMRVVFCYQEETPQEQPQPEKKEDLPVKELVPARAKETIHDLTALADDIDLTNPEALREVFSPVQQVAWLEYLYEGYTALKNQEVANTQEARITQATNERMITGLLYSHFEDLSQQDFMDSLPDNKMGKTLQTLLLKIKNDFKDRDLSYLEDGIAEIDTEIIMPVLNSVSRDPNTAYREIRTGTLSRVGVIVFGARFHEAGKSRFFDFEETCKKFLEETGMQLNAGEKAYIAGLSHKDIFPQINKRMKSIGLDLEEIGNPEKWLENHNESVIRSTMTESEMNLGEEELKKLIETRMAANKIIHEIPDIDSIKNLHLKQKIMIMMMLAAMFSQHIQKGMEEGLVAEQQGPGGPG